MIMPTRLTRCFIGMIERSNVREARLITLCLEIAASARLVLLGATIRGFWNNLGIRSGLRLVLSPSWNSKADNSNLLDSCDAE